MFQEQKTEELTDIKALKEIQLGLTKIILLEKKNKQTIRSLKNSHYKYASIEEFNERTSLPVEYPKICKKDTSTQTSSQQNEDYLFLNSTKVVHDCINEFFKQMVRRTNMEPVQNQEREVINLQHNKMLTEMSTPNNKKRAEFLQESIPKDAMNLLNFDSSPAYKKKMIIPVSDPNVNIQNNDEGVFEVNKKSKQNMEDEMVSTISVRPADIISNRLDNVSSKAIAEWHIPEVHCQSNVSSYDHNPVLPSYRMPMASGFMNKGSIKNNQTVPEIPSMPSRLTLHQENPSNIINEQPNPFPNIARSTNSLLPTYSSLPPAPSNHHPELNLTHGSPTTLLNRQQILKSSSMNDSFPGCRNDEVLVQKTSVKYYPPKHKNNSNPGSFNQVQGMNSVGYQKDNNRPIQQSYPMEPKQYYSTPYYSQTNDSFSFYDNNINSAPRIMATQHEGPNIAGPNSLMTKNVGPQHLLPFNLSSEFGDEPTSLVDLTRKRGRGSRNTSTVQRTSTKQSSNIPGNASVNINPSFDNSAMQSWPSIPTQCNNSFRTIDSNYTPNSNSQFIISKLRSLAPTPNIENDPKDTATRLPPYCTIRRKNNGFNPTLPIEDSGPKCVPVNIADNCIPNPNPPIALQVSNSEPFPSAINNSFNLSVTNPPSSLTNVSVCEPVTSASTSVSRTQVNDSDILSKNSYRTSFDLYQNVLNIALRKAIFLLTRKNDLGFLEYNFKKMPIPPQAFIEALTDIEKLGGNKNAIDIIDDILSLLSQTNENFVNEKNMFPPQLLKVNNNDINQVKLDINFEVDKKNRHELTLRNDHLAFVNQYKIRGWYSNGNEVSPHDFLVKSYIQTRCYCLQCCTNKIVLEVNHTILVSFKHYRVFNRSKADEISEPLKIAEAAKRSLEKSTEERDSPLPLKKRITLTPPNEAKTIKDSEVSYPSTPMISIAELELSENISTNVVENKTDSVASIQNSKTIVEAQSSEISKNISTKNNESKIISDNDNLLLIRTSQNLSSLPLIQSSVVTKPIKLLVKDANRKPLRRPRKNEK